MGSSAMKAIFGIVILVLYSLSGPCASIAASQPDAGAILRDIGDKPALLPGEAEGNVEIQTKEAVPVVVGPKVFVKGFRIKGTTIFKEETLLPPLQGYIGKENTLSGLQQAADKITAYYAMHGYIARVYLPPQEIQNGIVKIVVIEGRLEEVIADRESKSRLNPPLAGRYITATQGTGEVIHMKRLERGMLLLNDLPGVGAASTLRQGTKEGLIQQVVKLTSTPLVTSDIYFDNGGSRASGEYRVVAGINLNSPTGIGDRLSVMALGSFGDGFSLLTEYGRITYQLPLGYNGLKLGGSLAGMDYELGADLRDSDSKGRATIYSVFTSYPLIRQRERNLSITVRYDHKELYNEVLGHTTSNKRVDVASLGLSGSNFDSLMGGGYTSLEVNVVLGKLDLGRWQSDLHADQLSAKSHGDYKRVTFNLYRMQRLVERTSLSLRLTHQIAFDNLDSSEEIGLGGAYNVRAYPANEATGDEGTLFSVELRQRLTENISVFGFYDYGRIRTNHEEWTTTTTPNAYDLKGFGGGIAYIKPGKFQVNCTVAERLGDNPGRNLAGYDSDGTKRSPRFWVTVSKYF